MKPRPQGATAAGFVIWLDKLGDEDAMQAASLDLEAVSVLTYHSAKGLEWPMVLLLDLDKIYPADPFGFTIESSHEFDGWRPLDGRWVRFWPWPYGKQTAKVYLDEAVAKTPEYVRAAEVEHKEKMRLLYVGMTRARDYLILCPRASSSGLKTEWIDSVRDGEGDGVFDLSRLHDGLLRVGEREICVPFESLTAPEAAGESFVEDGALLDVPAPDHKPVLPP